MKPSIYKHLLLVSSILGTIAVAPIVGQAEEKSGDTTSQENVAPQAEKSTTIEKTEAEVNTPTQSYLLNK